MSGSHDTNQFPKFKLISHSPYILRLLGLYFSYNENIKDNVQFRFGGTGEKIWCVSVFQNSMGFKVLKLSVMSTKGFNLLIILNF